MFNALHSLFKQLLEGTDLSQQTQNPNFAIACLLAEVAGADHDISDQEHQAKQALLQKLLSINEQQARELIVEADERIKHAASLYEFTTQLRELSQSARFDLIKAMWEVALADGEIDPLEDAVIRKAAELLYVEHGEFIRAKLMVTEKR